VKEEANDLKKLIETHPSIKYLFFNGQAALAYFERHVKDVGLPGYLLPSTSSAHAIPYLNKLERWSAIKSFLNNKL
jgi:G:T/U-mismatch repair DNA glycosylase